MKLTKEQIELISRHAGEQATLAAEQENARQDLLDKQRAERDTAGIKMPSTSPPLSMVPRTANG